MIREDRELLAELARVNGDMASLGMRIMEGSASAREQQRYAQRLIAVGERLRRRADGMGDELEQWVEKLSGEKPVESEVVKELAVRLLAMAVMLLRQHVVNKRGRCRVCGSLTWRLRFWCRRPRCAVFRSVDLAVGQGLDVVWWQLLGSVGREVRLEEVREWVEQRRQVARGFAEQVK